MATPAQYAAAKAAMKKLADAAIAQLSMFERGPAESFVTDHLDKFVKAAVDAAEHAE